MPPVVSRLFLLKRHWSSLYSTLPFGFMSLPSTFLIPLRHHFKTQQLHQGENTYAMRNKSSGAFRIQYTAAATAKSLQSCPTLCDPIDGSLPGSPIPGVLQARTLEWVAISFFNAWKWKVKVKSLSRVQLLATPWTVAFQAPPSMGFSRQQYWSGVPLPPPLLCYTVL